MVDVDMLKKIFDKTKEAVFMATFAALVSSLISSAGLLYAVYTGHQESQEAHVAQTLTAQALDRGAALESESETVICVGEPRSGCSVSNDVNVGCNGDPQLTGKQVCKGGNFSLKLVSTKTGGKCGFTELSLSCGR